MTANNKIYEKILESMEANKTLPWNCPYIKEGLPYNYVTKRQYNGRNLLMLWCGQFNRSGFMTYLQAKNMGGQVRKGEHGSPIVYFKPNMVVENEEGKEEMKGGCAKMYFVFNVSQIEGLPELEQEVTGGNLNVEQFIQAIPVKINYGKKPHFELHSGEIGLPYISDCKSEEEYYSMAFHEIVHWTGTKLDREMKGYGTDAEAYSYEELIAELGSAFLRGQFRIDNKDNIDNSASYLNGWLSALKNDKDMLFKACKEAEKAVDYLNQITHFKQEEKTQEEQTTPAEATA